MQEYFLDSGGIDLLVDPGDIRLVKIWQRHFGKAKHCLSTVAYWEYLRQFKKNENALRRQRFVRLVKRDFFEFLPFDKVAADLATDIYHEMNSLVGEEELKRMHCDIMIAAVAVSRGKTVLTEDVEDWNYIKLAVEGSGLGMLPVADRKDILGE